MYDNDIDGYGKFLFNQGPQLRVKERQLRVKEQQLRDRLAQLGVKEDRLRDDKRRMEENLKKQKNEAKPLSEYSEKFNTEMADDLSSDWDFDFVLIPEFRKMYELLNSVLLLFTSGTKQDTIFDYPVVDGASGSGKSRLCWEVGKYFVKTKRAQLSFVDCSNEPFRYGREDASKDFKRCLANILFDRFVPASAQDQCSFSLVEVLE